MGVDIARETALKALVNIIEKKGYSNLVLDDYLKDKALKPLDRAFVSEIVYGTIRFLKKIDFLISHFSKVRLKKISPWIMNILRMGVYQIVFMKVPVSASCNESVKLGKRYGHNASAGFINGLLRNLAKNYEGVDINNVEDRFSFEKWMVDKWILDFGEEFTFDLLESLNKKTSTCIRINTLKTDTKSFKERLKMKEKIFSDGKFLEQALYINNISVEELEGFKEGEFYVQDESSMICSNIVDPKEGQLILDVCSAPGGKASHMASIMKNKGKIIACDIHPHRTRLIEENFKRLGVDIGSVKILDALEFNSEFEKKFDKVLVDAPCSGLGIIRRKPEIKWEKTKEDLDKISKLQLKMLKNASQYVAQGGELIYSTCTMNKQENEQVVERFLNEQDYFKPKDITENLPQGLKPRKRDEHFITLYPNLDEVDGFFISKLVRL